MYHFERSDVTSDDFNKFLNIEFRSIKSICSRLFRDLIISTDSKKSLLFHSDHIVELHQYHLKCMMKSVICL